MNGKPNTPLIIIFNTTGVFPDLWKKGNIIPIHKKESKNVVNNYRQISLMPIYGKVFEKVIFNSLFEYLQNNNILSKNQSGFRSGDSCVSQLISITHARHFTAVHPLKQEAYFLTFQRHLIKFGTKDVSTNQFYLEKTSHFSLTNKQNLPFHRCINC